MSCPLPFINLEARTDGTISVCCIMQDHARKSDGSNYNLAQGDTLTDVRNSEWLANLQQDFLDGVKPSACNNCWHEEAAGIHSKRLREIAYWGNHTQPNIRSLDLKLGNICNSKCRICSSFASSQWAAEEIKLNPNNKSALMFNHLGRWPERNEQFWTDIDQYLNTVEKLEFYGGEPLLIERHYDILERAVELGRSKDITVSYNTNGSIYPEHRIELWKQFKRVEVFFSLDDVDERFHYIRYPGDFASVVNNLKLFAQLPQDTFELGIFQTFSVFNIATMTELTDYCDKHLPGIRIHYNMVFTPAHISPKALPKYVKERISIKYHNAPDYVQRTLNFMNGEHYSKDEWINFLKLTQRIDQHRRENFVDTFPELYELIKRDWHGIQ
jgi:pyruvate-formate lyase-activating enzyme